MGKDIEDVKSFWENTPLFSGESKHEPGSKPFFEEHTETYYDDVFAGKFKREKFISTLDNAKVLDLGCGVGFWTIEIQKENSKLDFYSGDLTQMALDVTSKCLENYNFTSTLSQQNTEKLTYENGFFDQVNCQEEIHLTPDTDQCVAEIAQVTKQGGSANISVYYKNFFIRNWKSLSWVGRRLSKKGGGLKGRGREAIFAENDTDEITRLYDGDKNPIGKSYTKKEFHAMVAPYFEIEQSFLYFFPARALPFKLPKFLHRFMARFFGFMIHVNLRKK